MVSVQDPEAVTFVGESDLLAAVGRRGVLMMWNVQNAQRLPPFALMASNLSALSINPTGTMLICAEGKRVVAWSLPDRVLYKLKILPQPPSSLAVDVTSQTMALGFADGRIVVRPWPRPNANNKPPLRGPGR